MIGVAGAVALRFATRGSRTVLAHSRVEAPMQVVRPFETPDGRLVVQLITLGPGLCAGDALDVSITCESGARVVVTTPAASRIMAMAEGERAEQHVRLDADAGAWLEYYPAVAIPFPGSTFVQTLTISARRGARLGVVETWALGRQARGEYLQFARLSTRTSLAVEDTLAYADAIEVVPRVHDAANRAILAGCHYVASGFWYGAAIGDGDATTDPMHDGRLMAFAHSRPDLVYLRALAPDGPALDDMIRASLDRVAAGWGVPRVRLDRFRC
jgi:urease accessory protein